MTSRPVRNTYPRIRRAETRIELDRGTWAENTFVVMTYDTVGTGVFNTELIDFGVVFEGRPFFSYGVELQGGEELVDNDYPMVTAGVAEWQTTEIVEDQQSLPFYLGAYLFISVDSSSSYRLRFRLAFEGIAMRNVEYFRGSNG